MRIKTDDDDDEDDSITITKIGSIVDNLVVPWLRMDIAGIVVLLGRALLHAAYN